MPLNSKEKYMSYIEKVGAPMNATIRLDRRQRSDKNGWWSERLPETWEEAHEVLIEYEAVNAGSRSLDSRDHHPSNPKQGSLDQQVLGQPGGRSGSACYNMRDRGE